MSSAEQIGGGATGGVELAKAYKPSEHEGKVWKLWMDARAFEAQPGRVLRGERQPFSVLIPPPNVTAALHLGHALNNTLQDALVRMHRMMGYETLWMPGTDHAGIATQAVVEKRVMKEEKKRKTDFTREAFVEKIQAFKDEYEKVITGQLQAMACSCDWSRQRFTMDEQCAAAVREAFFRLFRDGLIYRGKRLVNWDPALQTAVADDECYDEEIDGAFYYLRYPVVKKALGTGHKAQGEEAEGVTWGELAKRGYPGASEHDANAQAWVTVATTRPETYLGDTAVALNPADPRAASLAGLHAQLPLLGRVIPIITDSYVVLPERYARSEEEKNDPKAKMATGFLKVTPAHDPNDYEIGQRHSLPMVNMMSPDGKVSDKHGLTDVREASVFVGLKMAEARKKVVEEFKARGLFEESKPHRHSVKHSDRSKAVVEPYLSDQWYVRVTDPRMAQGANEAVRRGTDEAPMAQRAGAGGTGVSPVLDQPARSDPYHRLDPISSNLNMHFRNLPHFQAGGSTYFVTFRVRAGELSPAERDIAMSACRHWHGERAEVLAVVVMPDHVHMLIAPFEASPGKWHSLSELLHSIKSFSSHQICELRKAKGSGGVWQDESFDRIVRDGDEMQEKIAYMQANPIKRGLAEKWREYAWTFVSAGVERGQLEFAERVRGGGVQHVRGTGETPVPPGTGKGTLQFFPERYAKTYEDWHNGIRDWCISRQLWWGHRIPVWSRPGQGYQVNDPDDVFNMLQGWAAQGRVAIADIVVEAHLARAGMPQSKSALEDSVCVRDPVDAEVIAALESAGFTRDPDVLDTWFSSALWPLSTMGWPDASKAWADNPRSVELNKGLLEAFNPTSVLCTAREIITLWVSRMVMFNRYFLAEESAPHAERGGTQTPGSESRGTQGQLGPAPFRHVYIHAVVQDGEGRKMSKSLGNGVDPLDIIATHGSDAMRYTLCQMATQTQDVRMPVQKDASGKNTSPKFDLGRNFANKVWNASRFALGMIAPGGAASGGTGETPVPPVHAQQLSLLDRWMLSRLQAGVEHATSTLRTYQFAEHAQGLYQLVWNEFCDWYLEGVKPTIAGDVRQQAVLHAVLDSVLRLLHPTMPSITESLWQVVHPLRERAKLPTLAGVALPGVQRDATPQERALLLLTRAPWPVVETSVRDERSEGVFDALRGVVGAIRDVRATHKVAPSRKIVLHVPAQGLPFAQGSLAASERAEADALVCTFAGLARIERGGAAVPGMVSFSHEGVQLGVSDLHDAAAGAEGADAAKQAERARLEKLVADLGKSIATLEGRLGNPGYADKAPAHMVQQTRDQLAKAKQELAAAQAALG